MLWEGIWKMKLLLSFLVVGSLLISGCLDNNVKNTQEQEKLLNCSDGTLYGMCSQTKPFYCENGTLVKHPNKCGCPNNYKNVMGENCEEIIKCKDGTTAGECSENKPFYCVEGEYMIQRADYCGCPKDEVAKGDNCISKFEVFPKEKSFVYVIDSKHYFLDVTLYEGVYDYLKDLNVICYSHSCVDNYDIMMINNNVQYEFLIKVVDEIKKETTNKDEQARIAISLVQHIPYAYYENNRYPYVVLYDNKGVCGEKSRLLAYLLRELGYGVALFSYEEENHMAVGIKCLDKYDYKDTRYCFIESTVPSIITDSLGEYEGGVGLDSMPEVIIVSGGTTFDATEEYYDAKEWNRLYEEEGDYLSKKDYNKWLSLVKKYDIDIDW